MTEPAPSTPASPPDDAKRLDALRALAQANLVRKAKEGKTLTAQDWTELRRMMTEAGLGADLPWMHETMTALATALGISVRTLENWRPRGAPLGAEGPFDELAVRLWVNAEAAAGKRMGKLADPVPALAAYVDLAGKARTARPAQPRAAGDGLKRKQEAFLDLKMDERRQAAQRQATEAFLAVLGKLDQLWDREVGSLLAQRLWDLAHDQTAAASIPAMQTMLRDAFRSCRRRSLGK